VTKACFKITRRQAIGGLASAAWPLGLWAQEADKSPIKFIVITAAGGAADQIARLIATRYSAASGRIVVVENKVGAGGNIATEFVARSPPDGRTYLFTSNNQTINPFIYKNAGYSPDDLVPVIEVGSGPSVLAVHPTVPAHTVKDLVELSKKQKLAYSSTGLGSASNLACELIKSVSGLDMVHVPYKGGAEAISAVLGNQVPVIMTSLTSAGPHIKAGALRGLAVSTATRWPKNPDMPTIAEAGYPACTYEVWQGILAPKGTPVAIIEKMNADIAKFLSIPEIQEQLVNIGYKPVGKSSADFARLLSADRAKVGPLVKRAGLQVG